jgi:hypothetical protein
MNWMGGRRRHSNNHTKDAAKQYFSRKKETAGANSAPPPGPKAAKKQIESWGGDVLYALRTLIPNAFSVRSAKMHVTTVAEAALRPVGSHNYLPSQILRVELICKKSPLMSAPSSVGAKSELKDISRHN